MARIVWAPKALDDLEALIRYIAADAPFTARRFGQRVIARVELLAEHPLSGSIVPEDDSRTYRQLTQGNYRIIYRFDGQTVYVLAVHHAARLLDVGRLE